MINSIDLRSTIKDEITHLRKRQLILDIAFALFLIVVLTIALLLGAQEMTPNYALTVRITEEEREQIMELKKHGKSQHDVVRVGLKVLMQRLQKNGNIINPQLKQLP